MNRKKIKKQFVKFLLRWPMLLMLAKHNPTIIAITGSVGKTSTKEAIYAVLKKRFSVWRSLKNYNTELGIPLAVFGLTITNYSVFSWLGVFIKMMARLIRFSNYPDFLVLELGIDKPGDMAYLLKLVRPEIAVVTAISDIPVHVQFFSGPRDVAREKMRLVKALPPLGVAVLNHDDSAIMEEADKVRAKILSFGFSKEAEVRTDTFEMFGPGPDAGITFKLEHKGSFVPVRLKNVFGKSNVYTALAAAAVGLTLGMNLVEISEAFSEYISPPGRLRLLPGIKNSWILDDTYNASPVAVAAALEVMKNMESKRDIIVLGDMKELGEYSEKAHLAVGDLIFGSIKEIWTVGDSARLIGEQAVRKGFDRKNVYNFEKSEEVGRQLQDHIKSGDLILIKGSQSLRMEKIVEEIMAEPQKAKELLVRQEPSWTRK
ncbi:hypothetical protein A2833_01345 [Candidatus Azambacteria bacterium RIFCSPHIGHO2_01_FULL_44_55]|nr:MAG: hypothetical protein A3A18_01915 [Candidatus Azambacteria bacterium RIFCSPLOWO2_01_FULL_44_84]OGD33143.1 MAG: hypothetical protein A3C78_02675 [Candidatus Azambacteria bacterium RIFCSPHIGHO2_02_FULL_45_18]OGD39937.1 MAG: hypothetical protein A2833_01345 [Candidatus Azambacteria bacterium RIFCSPHIGHO2_01_FULL_44_55]